MKTESTISYNDVANFFLSLGNETGEVITNLKLQKLVYYAQAWFLANFKKPLFQDDFEAWVHGPVLPALYHSYKKFGYSPILVEAKAENIDELTMSFLNEVAKIYMSRGAFELEAMTHRENPWLDARDGCDPDENCSNIISKESMLEFYGSKISS